MLRRYSITHFFSLSSALSPDLCLTGGACVSCSSVKRPLIALALACLLLSACGSSTPSGTAACASYWFDVLGACLPEGWHVLDRTALDERGAPEDVIVAFQMDDAVSGQYPTVTVTREPLASVMASADYGRATQRTVSVLPGFKELDTRTVKVDGKDAYVYVFLAQPVKDEPQRRFSQMSVVQDKTGYAVTAITPVSVKNTVEAAVTQILQSITFTAPVSSAAAQ